MWLLRAVSLSALLSPVVSLNILLFVPGYSNSHILFNYGLAGTLRDLGHSVTLWNSLDASMSRAHSPPLPANVTEHIVRLDLSAYEDIEPTPKLFQELAWKDPSLRDYQRLGDSFKKSWGVSCRLQFEEAEGAELIDRLSRQHWDVVLSYNFCLCPLAIATRIGAGKRFAWVTPGTFIVEFSAASVGLTTNPSFVPQSMAAWSDRMSFRQRLYNSLLHGMNSVLPLVLESLFDLEDQSFRPPPDDRVFPHLVHLAPRIPMILINGEAAIDFPRPYPYGVAYLGQVGGGGGGKSSGRGKSELVPEWERLVSAKGSKGVVVFSMGTIANTSAMPTHIKNAFRDAFRNLTSYTVIWRMEAEVEGLEGSPHVHLVKYLPQKELLRHPNTKLFISHGGYNSILETTKAGVPLLLMPLFADQFANAERAQRHGLGLTLHKADVRPDTVSAAINAILHDPGYAHRARKFSGLLNDAIVPPAQVMDRLLHKIAHKREEFPTLKAALRLHPAQVLCLDVLGLFSVALCLAAYLICRMMLYFTSFFRNM